MWSDDRPAQGDADSSASRSGAADESEVRVALAQERAEASEKQDEPQAEEVQCELVVKGSSWEVLSRDDREGEKTGPDARKM